MEEMTDALSWQGKSHQLLMSVHMQSSYSEFYSLFFLGAVWNKTSVTLPNSVWQSWPEIFNCWSSETLNIHIKLDPTHAVSLNSTSQKHAGLCQVFILMVTTRSGNPRGTLYSNLRVPAYVFPQWKAAACLNSILQAYLNSFARLWWKLLLDPPISQEKSKKSSFEPRFPGKETEATPVHQVCAAFLTSALGPSNSQLITGQANWFPCRCGVKKALPSPVQQAGKPVTAFWDQKEQYRLSPTQFTSGILSNQTPYACDPQGTGVFGSQWSVTISQGTYGQEVQASCWRIPVLSRKRE